MLLHFRCLETEKTSLSEELSASRAASIALKEKIRICERENSKIAGERNDLETQVRYLQTEKTRCKAAIAESADLKEQLKLYAVSFYG